MNITLTSAEAAALAKALQQFVIRSRTGELGIPHGAGRFVSKNLRLKKGDRTALNQAAQKLGMTNGIPMSTS